MRKKALVTGASRGIGRGIALKLASKGYDVAITYNTRIEGAKSLALEIEKLGGKCYYYQASLEKAYVPQEITTKVIHDLGGIDLLVCNAGLTKHNSILDMSVEFIDFLYGLNYRSYIMCAKVASNYMVDNDIKGNIIFITSTRGTRAYETDCIYGSLKSALNRAVESIAIDLAKYGIRINAVAPGATSIRGDFDEESLKEGYVASIIPLKRKGSPEDIGNLVHFLASEDASYITGDMIKVDGGLILSGPKERN